MRRFTLGIGILVALGMAPAMFADITDYMLNINGSTFCPTGTFACATKTGLTGAGATGTLDTSYLGTGLGTVSITDSPGPGTYNVALWIFENLATPAYNEYGATGGTATANQAGLSWQIDVPDYDYGGELAPTNAGTIIANTAVGVLGDVNNVPGTTSDYFACAGPTCNDYTSMALGFNFTLGVGQEEVLSFNVTTVAPSAGFYLEQIHPVDGSNTSATDYFYTATATTQPIGTPPPPTVPEPGSVLLLATIAGGLFRTFRSRYAAVNEK